MSENGYIQGAGDDSEGWSHGLSAAVFWQHRQELLAASEEETPGLISHYMTLDQENAATQDVAVRIGTTNVYVGTSEHLAQQTSYDAMLICKDSTKRTSEMEERLELRPLILYLKCGQGKLGSRALRTQLPKIVPFLTALPATSPRILCTCPTGRDLAIGVALAVLCLFYDENSESIQLYHKNSLSRSAI